MKATIKLESGQIFSGFCMGGMTEGFTSGIVFNTSMTGVTEILTDPSSMGQAIVLTNPLIGNYGVCYEDFQSDKPHAAALIVSELSEIHSNFRSEDSLKAVLERFDIPVITGIDTRSLVRLLRSRQGGESPRTVSVFVGDNEQTEYPLSAPPLSRYHAERRSVKAENTIATVAVADTGLRRDLERMLLSCGVSLEVFPYGDVIDGTYDGYLLPGGPGNPEDYDLTTVKTIIQTGKPVFAVGLGHHLLALANGAKITSLSPGHRGANIPVRDIQTGKVAITNQNHGFTVDTSSVESGIISHVNVNDSSVEGLSWREDMLSVQFQPDVETVQEFVKILEKSYAKR